MGAAPEIARLLAPLLGWDEDDMQREVDRYAGAVWRGTRGGGDRGRRGR